MSVKILDGKIVRDRISLELKEKISTLATKPRLAIIKIGDNPDSEVYVGRKISLAQKIGVEVLIVDFKNKEIGQKTLVDKIKELNEDKSINGIIIQAPLPKPLDWLDAVSYIDPVKDVDGVSPENIKRLISNDREGLIPATAKGVLSLLNFYNIPLKDKKVTVMGRSVLVGGPVATLLANNGAAVNVCHSQTENKREVARLADILIVAIGKPNMIDCEYVKAGQVVVDVGITSVNRYVPHHLPSQTQDSSLEKEEIDGHQKVTVVGDVDFDSVKNIVSAISPVPGGVGPMTVVSLFQNLIIAFEKQALK